MYVEDRPFKSIKEAREHHYSSCWWNNNDYKYLCEKCEGRGRYRKNEDRDPYEGWKLAPWYKCEKCNGTGEGTKEEFMEWYEKEQGARLKYKAKLKERDTRRKNIRSKLTKSEIEFIKRHGI